MALRDESTDTIYSDEQIAEMRGELERETGLNLESMSDVGVVANYLSRQTAAQLAERRL